MNIQSIIGNWMKDFTLKQYDLYLEAIKRSYNNIITFKDYFEKKKEFNSFCIIRHDVDRKPKNALRMAKIEHAIGEQKIDIVNFTFSDSSNFKQLILEESIMLEAP